MVIGTRSDAALTSVWTYDSFYNQLKASLPTAGFTDLYDEFIASSVKNLVYRFVVDAAKTAGTFYVRVQWNLNYTIATYISSAWNVSTHTGSNEVAAYSSSAFSTAANVNFIAVKAGTEFSCLMVNSGSNDTSIAVMIPVTRNPAWNLDQYPYGFLCAANDFNSWKTPSNSYVSGSFSFTTSLNANTLSSTNLQSGKRDIGYGIIFWNPNGQGFAAKTSDELCSMACNSLGRYNLLRVDSTPARDYLILCSTSGGLGVRLT